MNQIEGWLEEAAWAAEAEALAAQRGGGVRDLTASEVAAVAASRCPFCRQSGGFFFGPVGGMSQNIACECGARFNITPFRGFNWQLIQEPRVTALAAQADSAIERRKTAQEDLTDALAALARLAEATVKAARRRGRS